MPILPGATIGILGGGQLGRMMTIAARTLGYHVHILDPDPACAAAPVADRVIAARFDDPAAAAELARGCDVVTLEIEKISLAALEAAAAHAPLRPGAHAVHLVQNRARQKRWLREHGFPVGPYEEVGDAAALSAAVEAMGPGAFIKSNTGGYDGRGQLRAGATLDPLAAWQALGGTGCVVERALDLEAELSVLVARRPGGALVAYPPARNEHAHGVLDWSVIPGALDPTVAHEATEIACRIARALDVVGLIVAELFLTRSGEILVNELAPRPHNSYHHTELTALTNQFEQAIRAVCDLPLGSAAVLRPAAIANLFGDLWLGDEPPRWADALALPAVRIHLYGKSPRPGRKMGHLGAVGDTPDAAVALALDARARLDPAPDAARNDGTGAA